MTKILVFSDSHGCSRKISETLKIHSDADLALFLGDGITDFTRAVNDFPNIEAFSVKGNCDICTVTKGVPAVKTVYIENLKIIMTHGNMHGVKAGLDTIKEFAVRENADICLFGHTHAPFDSTFNTGERILKLFNPGSIGRSRSEKNSFGIITIDKGKAISSHGYVQP